MMIVGLIILIFLAWFGLTAIAIFALMISSQVSKEENEGDKIEWH